MTLERNVRTGTIRTGNVDVAYDARGTGEPLLLIAGFSMTRAMWNDAFCERLASRGYEVVRLDNRDVGASSHLDAMGVPNVPRLFARMVAGFKVEAPYRLEDMAADAVGLMRSLGHERFHVVGASMGGMIAQTMALDHPSRVASLTSIMSTPGGRRYALADPRALRSLLQRLPQTRSEQVEHYVRLLRRIGGDAVAAEEANLRRLAESLAESHPSMAASARQFAAILEGGGRRRPRLHTVRVPTLVVHGSRDPLLPVRGARAMARMIPKAELLVVEGMGHLVPTANYDLVTDAIVRIAKRAASVPS